MSPACFSDGIADQLIGDLSRLPGLFINVHFRPLALGLALPIVAALSGHDDVG